MIRRVEEIDDKIGEFINKEFTDYGHSQGVKLNYDEFCFISEDGDGNLTGAITGRAYYDEVHIVNIVTLTTFGFQAPEFYKKLGYELEFVREKEDPRLSKYFFKKKLS